MGDHIRKRRLELGLLQREVADRIGSDAATLVNWEKGNTAPALRFMPVIVAFLGYDPTQNAADASLGTRIAARRRALGLSRRKLAAELGVDETTIARWERGRNQLRPTGRLGVLFRRWLAEAGSN
ncbi:MAG: transcriptional regulator [Deltaproteobacteria bacterium]|nr:transcriptional regulator [Deltaproteobacteria bacterium]